MTTTFQHKVYRVNLGEKTLTNTNAANPEGLVYFLDQSDKKQIKIGDTISAFIVQYQNPERYTIMRQNTSRRPTTQVGIVEKDVIGHQSALYYSFPQDGDWEAQFLGSVPLQDFYDACNEIDPLNDLALDEQVEVLTELLERNNL